MYEVKGNIAKIISESTRFLAQPKETKQTFFIVISLRERLLLE